MKTKLLALILGIMTVISMLPASALEMAQTVTSIQEEYEQLPEAAYDETVIAAESNIYETYGTKIFHEDFSDFSDGTVLVSKNNDANGYTQLDGGAALISTFSGDAKDAMSITTVDGNKLVKVEVPVAKNGKLYYIYVNMPGLTFTAGKYYALSRYYFVPDLLTKLDTVYDSSFTHTSAQGSGTTVSSWYPNKASDGVWTVNVKAVEVTESNKGSMKQYAFFNTRPYTTNGGYYYLDDLAVYFKPLRNASYNLDGGMGTFSSFTYYDYEQVTLSDTVPTKTGCIFMGWKASTSGKTYEAGATIPAAEIGKADADLTLTAVWQANESGYDNQYGERLFFSDFEDIEENTIPAGVSLVNVANGYTATFSTSMNSSTDSKDVYVVSYNGSKMARINSVSGSWTSPFVSVYLDSSAAGKYSLIADYYSDKTDNVSANAGVVFNRGGGSNQVAKSAGAITAGGFATKVYTHTNPANNALYLFDWTVNGTSVSGAKFYVDNIALYFKPTRTAVYNLDGGEGSFESISYYDYEAVKISETAPTKTGFIFEGWRANIDGKLYAPGATIAAEVIGKEDEDLTLTAVWDEIIVRPYNESYGESIFYHDFEKSELGTTLTGTPRYIADGNTVKFVDNAGITIDEYNGSKMAKLTKSSSQVSWWGGPHLSVDVNLGTTGKYTVYADYYAPEGCSVTTDARITLNGVADNASVMRYAQSISYAYSFVLTENKQRFAYVAGISTEATENYTPFYLDNLELFYKPTRTASFNANGGEGTSPALTYYDYEDLTLPENTFTKENYVFKGWQSSLDGKIYKAGEVIPAAAIGKAEDALVLTAVWEHKLIPSSYKENSIRINEPSGIRFKASVRNETKADEKTTEYGYIVTRASLLGTRDAEYLTFEQTDVKYVSGVSYGYDSAERKNVDRVFDIDGENTIFTAVIYGILETKEAYEEEIVVRPYIKYDGETLYGEPMSRSVLSVAKAIRDSGYKDLDEYGKQRIQTILEICGESL